MVLRKLHLVQDTVLSHGLVEVANDMKCVIIKKNRDLTNDTRK